MPETARASLRNYSMREKICICGDTHTRKMKRMSHAFKTTWSGISPQKLLSAGHIAAMSRRAAGVLPVRRRTTVI